MQIKKKHEVSTSLLRKICWKVQKYLKFVQKTAIFCRFGGLTAQFPDNFLKPEVVTPYFFLCKWTTYDQNLLWQIMKKFYRQSFTAYNFSYKYGIFGVTMPLITVPKLKTFTKKLIARNFRISSCHIQNITNVQEILNFIPSDQVKPGRDTLNYMYSETVMGFWCTLI